MKPLVVIPARGGSKGVPRKNIKLLNGKPLIHYTIEAARKVFDDAFICVSTDDEEIKEIAELTGIKVPFLRPTELAIDTAGTYEVLLHAIKYFEKETNYYPDILILLQPTSPFRNEIHIKEALEIYKNSDCEMTISVKETKANPYYLLKEESDEGWLISSKEGSFTRRQDCPKVYELNGAVYVIDVKKLKEKQLNQFEKVVKYEMNEMDSIDIDTYLDWQIAEIIISEIC